VRVVADDVRRRVRPVPSPPPEGAAHQQPNWRTRAGNEELAIAIAIAIATATHPVPVPVPVLTITRRIDALLFFFSWARRTLRCTRPPGVGVEELILIRARARESESRHYARRMHIHTHIHIHIQEPEPAYPPRPRLVRSREATSIFRIVTGGLDDHHHHHDGGA
jgi:hypothetical protein